MAKRKTVRFYPFENDEHRAILKWLETQPGTDNDNLIHLMIQGRKFETGEASGNVKSHEAVLDTQNLLPEIRKIVNSAISSALREANFQLNPKKKETVTDEETQAFLIDMAENF